jgi:two-component system phosphate regulon sensor histidine kinase PhoR
MDGSPYPAPPKPYEPPPVQHDAWLDELWRFLFVLMAGVLFGLLLGHMLIVPMLFVSLYVARQVYYIQRLLHWLGDPEQRQIPSDYGIWGDVYAHIAHLLKDRRQREQHLKALLRQSQSLAAALPDAVISLGPMDEILWMNEAAQSLLGLRGTEDYGRPLLNLFRVPEFAAYLNGRDFSHALELPLPGAEPRWLSLRAVSYGKQQRLIIAQDVTERHQLERVRRDFVANVSHELRTPLTVISGFIENLRTDDANCPEQWRRPLALVGEQAGRMRHIVQDLLLLARLEGGESGLKRTPVRIDRLLRELAEEATLLAQGRQGIDLNIESTWLLDADRGLLRSAIGNLVSNAVHHTPAGGHIVLHWVDEPDASCIIVEDDGEGIAPEHIPRLTERFYRVDAGRSRERGGTGLGLAIVKHVLQVHDARLEILSTPGEGSQFICRFPATQRVPPAADTPSGFIDNDANT